MPLSVIAVQEPPWLGGERGAQDRCMTRFLNPPEGISQDALAGLVAEAVQQALMRHGVLLDAEALVCASAMAGSIAAALPFLPQAQRLAITSFKGGWTGFASEFFRTMAEKIARADSGDANSVDENPTIGAVRPAPRPFAEWASELQSMLIEDWAGEVAGSTYLEEKLRIPRSTLHRWQRRGEVVALRKGGRKHVFPLAQFVDGRPAPGISEVLTAIANPRLAWFWLTRPSAELGGRTPIAMLREDMIEDVVRVARSLP
ncbi:DUF2384 domain-containing protein [Mesorhizobium sp. VK24D]|uniref:DUF2384 domain-containing protein n=1 Tax=Mesorhizobium album TaxID=3072314 RepID=A0ABU4XQX0_9HYPH|nr:antitoxin Xre/MbcA/ParS toxin-binding domain-containing protein [Mesorhizobium sp. VK24D]MDX8477121.1 DUF2384 domain-containing protein [Mesorhizobium sp. VK24D]